MQPPTLGQHNEEILQALNISDQAIQQLKAAKIIGSK